MDDKSAKLRLEIIGCGGMMTHHVACLLMIMSTVVIADEPDMPPPAFEKDIL